MCKKTDYHGTSNTQIDRCLRPLIDFLQDSTYDTISSCCGHGKYPITIIVKERHNGRDVFKELLTQIEIPRKRRFYNRDKQGYYYIPEAVSKV